MEFNYKLAGMLSERIVYPRFARLDYDENYLTYVYGDLHGCLDELMKMVIKCTDHARAHCRKARFVCLGDAFDRGPFFVDVLYYLIVNGHYWVQGNHELNFALEHIGVKSCRSKARLQNHTRFFLLSEDEKESYCNKLISLPLVITAEGYPDCDYILTHAPIANIEGCDIEDILTRSNASTYCMRSDAVDLEAFNVNRSLSTGKQCTFLHGHQSWAYKDISDQVQEQAGNKNQIYNLDSGVVYGDYLTTFCLETKEIFKTKALKSYASKR